jgi:hypothetical protein
VERSLSSSSLKIGWQRSAQLYVWLAIAALNVCWGALTAIRPGHSQDLSSIHIWLRTWLWQGSSPYYLPDYIVANYPPHAIVALSPLALLPEAWVAVVWAALNFLLAPLVCYLAFRIFKPDASWRDALLPCAMFLAWAGLRTGLANGQFTLLVLGLGLLAFLFEEKRPLLGGLFLALALMKPHIGGVFLLWALFTKRWRMMLVACVLMGFGVCLYALRLMESPLASVRDYLSVLQHQFGRGADVQGSTALRVVELRPLIALFVHNEAWGNRLHQLLLVVLLGCAALVALLKSRLKRAQHDAAVLLLCCLWLLMSVFHNPYDTILLLPILMGLWAVAVPHPAKPKLWTDQAALWVLQLAMVLELPGIWWKLSKAYDLSAYNWAGALFANFDRVLVLGLFVFILNRARLYWLAEREAVTTGEMLAQP